MSWLKRLFGLEKPQNAQVNPTPQQVPPGSTTSAAPATTESIPPERLGLNGEYDQSGLAKRVALAFDQDSQLGDIDTLWVAQTSGTVVLKGKVPDQETLKKMVAVARSVNGATGVNTDEVTVG
ncbi:BON domain-containing protein [Nodularia spumigena]|uniref:Phospholipid-binding protein n=1 Tax=Nodularia spumigena CENA596 TaxID=1819295 RepID=A0A166JMI8_NODSP|nr:BON domain-containing protein [Nodularia spumigena]KZL49897.1 phospholipid-binding protein [Nodularia spumigena CENA596]MDB9306970.1 BON domain-containing protein [Nodularia spumigena CS-591/12]MDB9317791.1 BON domain-containing protein [Nodularia spumigena CS-590/01A]MDB9322894.1 BON domain-containing protein [Nodularia spumigena CS-591/07A]MDB9326922.1 BON domain-containing protein [Nodularia spumigena CS-590/02]